VTTSVFLWGDSPRGNSLNATLNGAEHRAHTKNQPKEKTMNDKGGYWLKSNFARLQENLAILTISLLEEFSISF
jgi:hypothetical protein